MSISNVVRELADSSSPLKASDLQALSGLSAEEVAELWRVWRGIDPARRRSICDMLVELAEDNCELDFEAVFRQCLDDEDEEVRVRAIDGLWECESRPHMERLLALLRGDPSETVRSAATCSLGRYVLLGELGKLRDSDLARLAESLRDVIEDADEPLQVRRRAVEAIGVLSRPWVRAILQEVYGSDEVEMRASALYGMGRNCDKRWLPTLVRELASPFPELRYEAARALGELEDERAACALVPLLEDPDPEVSLSAIDALGRIGGDIAKKALGRYARSGDERLRGVAAEVLEELESLEEPLTPQRFEEQAGESGRIEEGGS